MMALLVVAALASPRPNEVAATPVPRATPALIATPAPAGGTQLVLPPVPTLQTPPPTTDAQPAGDIVGVTGPFVGISLADAVGMGLSRNTDLAVSQSNRRIAAYRIVAAAGAYDLQFQIAPSYTFSQQPAVSSFNAGPNGTPLTTVTAGARVGVSGLTGSGGRIDASTSAQRIDNNLSLNSYDPYYETAFALSYSQPLARGRAIDEVRERIQLSKIDASVSSDEALLTASNTIDDVSVAYDNLVAAWKNVAIQEDALRQAKAQSESNGRLVRHGSAAPVDVVQSDQQVQEFQDAVFSAIQNVASLQNQLKALVLADPADPAWTANLVPTTPVGALPAEPKLDDVMVAALAHRPEIDRLRDDLRSQDVTIAYDRDQTKPQIDLKIGVTENGFAGAPLPASNNPFTSIFQEQITAINALIARSNATAGAGVAPLVPISASGLVVPLAPNSVGNIGTAYKSALAGQYPEYQIGATIAFPLRDRTARATYESAVEGRRQIVTRELGVIQRLQVETRNAVEGFRSARSRLIAATSARVAAQRVEESEIRKFRAGESTTYLVLQRQVFLANARGRELQAQTDAQNALVELDRVSGAILAKNGVDVRQLGTSPQGTVPDLLRKATTPADGAPK